MAQITCSQEIPSVSGLENNQLTVGRHFVLKCKGDWDKSFDFAKANFVLDDKSKIIIKLFKAEARDVSSFDLDMTLYAAGKVQFPELILTDGQNQLSLGELKFEVVSVLPKPEQSQGQKQEPPKPYGYAVGMMHVPMVYVAMLATLLFLLIAQVLRLAFRRKKWKDLNRRVLEHDSALSIDGQFYKLIRTAEKNNYPLSEIEYAAKLYILRQFKVPVFDLSIKETYSFIKNKYPRLKKLRVQVQTILIDLDLLKKDSELTAEKKNKFIAHFYGFIENCELAKKTGGFK